MRTTSFLENDISYVKKAGQNGNFSNAPVCEINAGVENMMKVLGVFLGLPSQQTKELIDMTPLNTLLELISTKDKKWKWQTSDGKQEIAKENDKAVNIVFYQNNKGIFTWIFMSGHFDTVVHLSPEANWLEKIGQKLLESKEILPTYFSLLVDESFIPKNIKELKLQPENTSFLLYSRNLWDTNLRLDIIGTIGDAALNSFLDLGKRLIDSLKDLALGDPATKQELIKNSFKSTELGKYLIKYFIEEKNLNINMQDRYGETLLHHAVEVGNLSFVKYLIEKDADINIQNKRGGTPIHNAVLYEEFDIVKYLFEVGKTDIHIKDINDNTPLHIAVENNRLDIVKYLVEVWKANINAKNKDGWTPLHKAARKQQVDDVLKYLVENGADLNAKNKSGATPTGVSNQKEVTNYLKQKMNEQK